MTTIARLSTGLLRQDPYGYLCAYDWPDNCFVQAGDRGLVFAIGDASKDYETAFFEAFPREPATFIRGEGATVQDAETSAWKQFQQQVACPGHEFERRGYTNGGGFCKHCDMWMSHAFEPSTLCCICKKPTDWTHDTEGEYYCQEHQRDMPLGKWDVMQWHIAFSEYEMWCHKNGVECLL